ncbi:hypothetical protein D3C72_1438210 [compost metagenome]
MAGLGRERGLQGGGDAGGDALGIELGATVGPFQGKGGGGGAGVLAEGDQAGEAGVGAQGLDMGAGRLVQARSPDQQARRGVDLLAQLLDGGFQRATREAVEGGGGQGAGGGDRQLGRLATMGLGDGAEGAGRMSRVLGQGR